MHPTSRRGNFASVRARSAFTACVLTLALAVASCSGEPNDGPASRPPDIILITIDTLRADHLSAYGYHRQTTPALDEIARTGTVFDHAYATSSWTVPSVASILTGLSPRSHGVRHGHFSPKSMRITEQEALAPRFPTLATQLSEAGYATFGLTSNAHLAADVGYDRGFDAFATLAFKSAYRMDQAIAPWLDRIRASEPYFLWIHYFDPHAPYSAREPWVSAYGEESDAELRAEWSGMVVAELTALAALPEPPPDLHDGVLGLYDSEISFVDRSIGRLLAELDPGNDALIVISADHGEELHDHGALGHGHTLYEELIRVPLIVKPPAGWERGHLRDRIQVPVSNQRILATILDIAGVGSVPDRAAPSLAPLMTSEDNEIDEAIFTDLDKGRTSAESVRLGKWKLIAVSQPKPALLLYDLDADPRETRDLSSERQDVVMELTTRLDEWRIEHPLFEPERSSRAVSETLMKQLRAMGYVE